MQILYSVADRVRPSRNRPRSPYHPPAIIILMAVLSIAIGCGSNSSTGKFAQKLVILGFDGMDPDLVRKYMDQGQLPNMKKLADQGGLYDLGTSTSPESPTAWASFATGTNAGKHNVY